MKRKKKVSRQEFLDFIKNYPRKLSICGIGEPFPLTYNDFELSDKFEESVVASTFNSSDVAEEKRIYFIESDIGIW